MQESQANGGADRAGGAKPTILVFGELVLERPQLAPLETQAGQQEQLVVPSSIAVDRLALYVMPLQVAVLSRFPLLFGPRLGTVIVVLYLLSIEFVWLNFATHAHFWVPYQVYPLL